MTIKVLGLATLFLGLVLAAAAERGPGGFRGANAERQDRLADRVGERDPLGRLTDALELDASQVAAAQGLLDQRNAAIEAIREQNPRSRQGLSELIGEGDDPAAIGNAVLALRQQFEEANGTFIDGFTNLLTETQRAQFENIQAMRPGVLDGAGFNGRGGRGAGRRGAASEEVD